MNWTANQQRAIDQRGTNILVAAAAGSGKTAVLVERIKKLIIEDGISLDRMLIVTFTNAAAAEMKEKIRKALNEEIDRDPAGSDGLRRQLALLPRANISTFHSFALEVIRRFFYNADIEPAFSICDDAQRTILKEESMDLLMESWFAEGSEEFYDFLGWYSGERSQDQVRSILDSAYSVLQSLPHPWQWLEEKIGELEMTPEEFRDSSLMEFLWDYIGQAMEDALAMEDRAVAGLEEAGLDRLAEKLVQEEQQAYLNIAEAVKERDFEGAGKLIAGFAAPRLAAKKEEKEDYAAVKDMVAACRKRAKGQIDDLKQLCFTEPLSCQVEEMNRTAPKARTLQKLLLDFDRLFTEAKAERHVIDFSDIEHFCLEILADEDAADYYRNRFEYIFIDEYQDTNILQEEIISRVKRQDNLFMVGDIKQSIYKFRLAEPEIFRRKYESYSTDPHSVKIDLNQNFRSKGVILDEINMIFSDLMEDYDENAMLYKGVDYDGPLVYTPQLKVVDTGAARETDEELANLKNAEIEALEVCRIISDVLGKPFYDHKKGVERTVCMRDIVVLMRGVRNYADIFYNVLKENGIESFVDDSEGYFDTIEINVFMNLLSVIDNKKQDVPLISVLHSEIFGFSSEELALIRGGFPQGSFAEGFASYIEEGPDESLREKCRQSWQALQKWKEQASSRPLGRFIWQLMLDTGYYVRMGAMPGGSQRQANLRALVDKAEGWSRDRQGSLYGFVRYIDAVKERKVPMGQVRLVGENDDLVRIMTIHKSKGLEFPVVIVSGLGRKLNYTKSGKGIALHKDLGLGMTLADFRGHWHKQTLIQRLIGKQIHREEVQEEIRILYVALTRARDMLYMTGTVNDGQKFAENRETGMGGDTCYLDMIQQVSSLEMTDPAAMLTPGAERHVRYGNPMDWNIYDGVCTRAEAEKIRQRLSFVYPHEQARKLKSKYSVTELNRLRMEKDGAGQSHAGGVFEPVLAVPKFRQEARRLTAAEKGTVYHGIMERIDFVRAEAEGPAYIREAAEDFISREIFTREEVDAVNLSRISDFFRRDIGKRCAAAFADGRLQRERSFNLETELEGETVMVQGIIDCFFEEKGEIVLLDYKSGWIDPARPFEEEADRLRRTYAGQMEIYRKALTDAWGMQVKECCLYLFGAGELVEMKEGEE
ncbi:MAG: helicase-exonuclease AddAB subunit AddA [Emergencia sp.]